MAGGHVRVGSWVRLLPPHTEAGQDGEYTEASNLDAGVLVFSNDSTERLPHEPSIEDAQRLLRELKLHDVAEFTTEQLHELVSFPYYHRVPGWHTKSMSAQPTPDTHPDSWVSATEFLPLRDVYVVRAVCPTCSDCLELECVTMATHDTLEPIVPMAVTVPPGITPGQALVVQAPDGQQMQATVPAGVMPGQQFAMYKPVLCSDDHMFKCAHMGHAGACVYPCSESDLSGSSDGELDGQSDGDASGDSSDSD